MRATRCIRWLFLALCLATAAAFAHPPPRIPKEQIPDDMPAHIRKEVEKLYSPNDRICTEGAKALGRLGEEASCAAPFLASVLDRHKTCPTPNAAAQSLIQIGKAAVEPTIVALRVGDRYGRGRTLNILAKLKDERAVPALVSSIVDGFGGRRAEEALRSIGRPALDYLLKGIEDEKSEVRHAAAVALPAFASSNVAQVLVSALGDSDEKVRQQAGRSILQTMDSRWARNLRVSSTDTMFDMLKSGDPGTRRLGLALLARTKGRWDEKEKAFIALLEDTDHAIRMQAIDSLGWFKEARVVAALTKFANDPADLIRARVATALGKTRREGAVKPLTGLLKDRTALVRENAMGALAAIQGRDAVKWLVKMLEEEGDPMLRRKIVVAIGKWKDAGVIDILAPRLDDPDRGVRMAAVDVFAESGTNGIPALRRAATNSNATIRRYTLDKFRHRYDPGMTETMVSLIDDKDWHVRERAMGWLSNSRWRIKVPDLAPIRARLKDRNGRVRGAAIRILARNGDKGSMDEFIAAASHWDGSVAGAGVEACRQFGQVDALVKGMKHRDHRVRDAASKALASLNTPEARKALAGIVKSGRSDAGRLADAAIRGVAKREMDPEMLTRIVRQSRGVLHKNVSQEIVRLGSLAVGPLTKLLADPSVGVRRTATDLLRSIRDESSFDGLLGALDDSDTLVREKVIDALGALRDKRAVRALGEALQDDDLTVREAAAEALGRIGSESAADSLAKAAADPDWHLRWVAVQSLGKLESPRVVEPLLAGLADEHWYVRRTSAEALGRVGGKKGIPRLLTALEDDHWYVRRSARIALFRISGKYFGEDVEKWKKWWESGGLE